MAGPYSAGTVFLQVVPSYDGFMKALQGDAKGIADELNKAVEAEVNKGKGIKPKIDTEGTRKDSEKSGAEAAKGFGGAFEKELQSRLRSVASHLPKIKPDVDTDEATRSLSDLGKQIEKLSKVKVGVDMDARQAIADIASLEAELRALSRGRHGIDFHVNTSRALAEVAGLRKSMEAALKDLQVRIDPRIEGAFEKRLKQQIKNAVDSIPPIKLDADSTAADRKVAALRTRLQSLGSKAIGVDVKAGAAILELAQVRDELASIRDNKRVDVQVRSDTAAANAALRDIEHLVTRINGRKARVVVDVDKSGGGRGGNGLSTLFGGGGGDGGDAAAQANNTANAFRAFNGVLLTAVTLGPALIPILGAIAGGLAAIGPMAIAGAAGLGILVAGFSGINAAVTALGTVQKNAGADSLTAARTQRSAASQVAGAQRTLSRALEDAAQANEDAQRRVKRAQDDATRSAVEGARRVAEAQRQAAQANEDAARRVADAQRAQSDAIQRASEASARAERTLADAQRDALRAQEDLAKAREDAARAQEDLAARMAGGRLDERQGVIDVFNATVANQAAQTDPGATNLEREQASLALERAQLALANTRRENSRMAAEKTKADKEGVNGSDQVKSAQDRVTQALQAQKDAQDGVRKAAADAREVQVGAARDVARALEEQRRTAAEGARSITEAERARGQAAGDAAVAIEDARRAQSRTAADGQRSIADARRGLSEAGAAAAEATAKVGEVGSASQRALDQAMGALGPAGRHFALFIFGLTDEWHAFRDDIQTGLLPGVEDAITTLLDKYTPQLHGFLRLMGGVLGDVFRQIGDTLTNPAWQEFFTTLGTYLPIFTGQFATFGLNVATAFANIFVALAPTSKDFGDWLVGLSEDFKNFTAGLRDNPEFQQFLGYIREVGPEVWQVTKDIFGAIKNIAEGLAPYGKTILDIIGGIAHFLATTDPKVAGLIAGGFIALIGAFQLTSGLVALIGPGGLLMSFGKSLLPLGRALIWVATTAIPALAEALGIAIGPFLLIVAAAAAVVVGLVILYKRSETFRDIVNGAFRAVAKVVGWFWRREVYPILKAVGDYFLWLGRFYYGVYKNYFKPTMELLGAIFVWLWSGRYGIRWAFGKIRDGFWAMWRFFKDTYDKYLRPWVRAFGDLMEIYLAHRFGGAVDAIRKIWDGLKAIAKAPIKFIVNTVLNNGLIAGFNKLAGFFHTTPIEPIHLPKGFAAGGRIGGHSPTPTADNIPIWATAGEFMQPVHTVRHYGADVMEAMRQRRIPRQLLRGALGLATGGLVPGSHIGAQGFKTGGTIGAGSHPVGGMGGLLAFGRLMRSLGFRVAEGPGEFGPVTGGHSPTSYHYHHPSEALDINWAAGTSRREQDAIDRLLVPRVKEYGLRLLWKIEDHFNHAHVDTGGFDKSKVGGGGEFGSGGGGFGWPSWLKGLDPVGWIKDKFNDVGALMSKEFAGSDSPWFKALKAVPGKLKDAVIGKVTGLADKLLEIGEKVITGGSDASSKSGIKGLVNSLAGGYGWDQDNQWNALSRIIEKESSWNPNAQNPTSTAYGLFQFLNSTWGAVGATKTSDPRKQAEAGLKYIKQVYGNPVEAWRWHQAHNWYAEGGEITDGGQAPTLYDAGGVLPTGMTQILNASGKPEAILTNSEWQLLQQLARSGARGPLVGTVDARSYGTDLSPDDVASAMMFRLRLADRGGRFATSEV